MCLTFFLFSFLGVSRSLPATAYIKMLDIWMIFCTLYPFLIVLFFALSEFLAEKKDDVQSIPNSFLQMKAKGYNIGNTCVTKVLDWGLPLISFTFISLFWTFGINNYFWPDVETTCKV